MAICQEQDKHYLTKEDICTHVGDDYAAYMGAIVPPIFQNSLFVRPTADNGVDNHGHLYTRDSNPTIEIAERKIAALESAEAAACFPSGMGAISAAILYFIKKDAHVILVQTAYGPTRRFITEYLTEKFGITYTAVHGSDVSEIEAAIRPETTLIYLESPSSFVFHVQDLEAIAAIAKNHGIGTVIDNSYATPLHQNPLLHGIDIVCHTASKYLGGHSDIVAGALAASAKIVESIVGNERELIGACMDPHQAWLLIRGMRTLPIRLKQHQENALAVARFLESHPKVERVYYPALESHPEHELFTKYNSGACGLLSFVPKGSIKETQEIINACKLFQYGCSWGGFESLIIDAAVGLSEQESKEFGVPQNLIRLHVGLENKDSLIADLEQALSVI